MANPQAEDGHIDIANDIGDALAKTHLSSYESRVLWCILRKTYGWHKKSDRISYTQFESATGLTRWHIGTVLKRLTKRNIIITSGTGQILSYGFQKDYDQWDTDPKMRHKKKKLILNGYIYRYLGPNNQYRPMANADGYAPEHRLIMAHKLGRLLTPGEIVHHVNHNRQDNRLDNLELTNSSDHLHETLNWINSSKTDDSIISTPLPIHVIVDTTKPLPEHVTKPLPELVINSKRKPLPVLAKPLPVLAKPLPEHVTKPLPELVNTKETKETTKEITKDKDVKTPFGEFHNVFLTLAQYEKLQAKFNSHLNEKIEAMSSYLAAHNKKYDNYYAAFLTWDRMDKKKQQTGGKVINKDFWPVR